MRFVEPLGGVGGPLSGHNFIPKTAFVKASLDARAGCFETSKKPFTLGMVGALAH
jgi:hypothetical protein